ncbi:MAG: hypothetical protein ACO3S4_11675 [Pseudohongiellaceae bacterium]
MRLVIEEAKDHTECMDKVRARYGTECVVVHSFKTDDRYRVIIALETPASLKPQEPTAPAITDVASKEESLRPTFWLEDRDNSHIMASEREDEASNAASLSEVALGIQNYSIPQEITAELIALAARVKALESAQFHQRLAPEPQEPQSMLFSDVLQDMVSERGKVDRQGTRSIASQPRHPVEATRVAASESFVALEGMQPTPSLCHSTASPDNKDLPLALSNVSLAEEAKSFVRASKGAASFAALLTDHVASSQGGGFMPRFEMTLTGH